MFTLYYSVINNVTDRSVMFIKEIFYKMLMETLHDADNILNRIIPRKYEMNITLAILIIATAGAFLQIGGTSWDVTSHVMQEPETFFTPSHTLLYTGVGLLTIAAGIGGVLLIKNKELKGKSYATAFKLLVIGTTISVVAGPSDFLWHETFGVDGLLSPPHVVLITGMLINSVAIVVGLARIIVYIHLPSKQRLIKFAMIPAFAALWFTTTWYVYMFSLPFSNGENFQFNLNSSIAVTITIIALPLLSSIIFLTASAAIGRFGAASAVAVLVVGVNVFANIIPTNGMISLMPWYLIMAIIPAVTADIILNNSNIKSKIGGNSRIIAGAIVGSIFYIFNYPMLIWVFATPLDMQLINLQGIEAVSILTSNFLSTLPTVLAITLVPAAFMGIASAYLSKKIAIPSSHHPT
jgi:hypothetical protein